LSVFKADDVDTIFGLSFNADGTMLASGGTDRQVTLWDVQGAKPILVLKSYQGELGDQGEISSVVFSPDGTKLAVAGEDGTVRLWGVRWPIQNANLKPLEVGR
jgi:WD40 repeat protein